MYYSILKIIIFEKLTVQVQPKLQTVLFSLIQENKAVLIETSTIMITS